MGITPVLPNRIGWEIVNYAEGLVEASKETHFDGDYTKLSQENEP